MKLNSITSLDDLKREQEHWDTLKTQNDVLIKMELDRLKELVQPAKDFFGMFSKANTPEEKLKKRRMIKRYLLFLVPFVAATAATTPKFGVWNAITSLFRRKKAI